MGGWGDDGVEWGKLCLGEGCCEDTEQESVIRQQASTESELEYDMTGLAVGNEGS